MTRSNAMRNTLIGRKHARETQERFDMRPAHWHEPEPLHSQNWFGCFVAALAYHGPLIGAAIVLGTATASAYTIWRMF